VYSRSQEDISRTGEITQQVKTEFENATYAEMQAHVKTLYGSEKNSGQIDGDFFMVLDKKSADDRKVVLISEGLRELYPEDESLDVQPTYEGADSHIWRKHRVPFEKVAFFYLVLGAKPGMEGDEFLQNTTVRNPDGL
jgi:hypothetical protein